jgi:hypothetical protein
MGLGNGNPKYGDKGSNYNFELSILQLLGQVVTAAGLCCPTAATEATLADILTEVSPVNRTPGFSSDTTSVIPTATPTGVAAFSLLFRGTGGELNGVVVPDNYRVSFGNGKDPITVALTYLRPAAGEVFISTFA